MDGVRDRKLVCVSGAMTERPLPSFSDGAAPPQNHDVRFIGAVAGRYALPDRIVPGTGASKSLLAALVRSARMAVVVAPVLGNVGSGVTAHFDAFGILRGKIICRLNSGFAIDIDVCEDGRRRLAAAWRDRL
ncbi:hypothetical protein [Devosia nitrariae]|uniref:Uncharacterized protein n=1 Tax=Devosia nitrariae TaxID=2071872 RepID=A0ABQ5WDN2_9HYPH|nr:hypothetical protein [Devosia nitrariae]GLQ57706.1 hypothetical protein GCM10010862_49650 [Devosia nitrariae]